LPNENTRKTNNRRCRVDKEVCRKQIKNASNNLNFFETGILKRIISESKHKENSRIEVITTSNIPKEIGPEYVKAFEYLNAMNVGVLYIEKRGKLQMK
jgi:cyanophycinase-like exopeptidase